METSMQVLIIKRENGIQPYPLIVSEGLVGEATFTRKFLNPGVTTYFDQTATANFLVQGIPAVRLGTDYSINAKHSIGAMIYFNRNALKQGFLTDTWISYINLCTPRNRVS